jgi:hypothetical protein
MHLCQHSSKVLLNLQHILVQLHMFHPKIQELNQSLHYMLCRTMDLSTHHNHLYRHNIYYLFHPSIILHHINRHICLSRSSIIVLVLRRLLLDKNRLGIPRPSRERSMHIQYNDPPSLKQHNRRILNSLLPRQFL